MHPHACSSGHASTPQTLDQTVLINNSWEMVAQPSCLQPQSPTTTGMLNTPFFTSSILSTNTWLRHTGTYFSPQRRDPARAELLTQTGSLRARWVFTKLWSAACVSLQKDWRHLPSLFHRGFDLLGPGERGSFSAGVLNTSIAATYQSIAT